jgi:hypothetical protein
MSDQDLRAILDQVITDLDSGRLQPPGRLHHRLGRLLAPPLLAVGLGLGAIACDGRNLGIAEGDATHQDDNQQVDAGIQPAYIAPEVDSGLVLMYGPPFPDIVDAAVPEDAEPPNASLYSAPF